jgi:prophage maintenance system killer protein/prophage antirepressor-like protein
MLPEVVLYQTETGEIEFRTDLDVEKIWASQTQIVALFWVDQSVVSRHIRNIFRDEEVDKKSNMQKMHIPNSDKPVTLYSLDIILAIGYRTNSKVAISFRQWATKTLKKHMVEGYTINPSRIQNNYELFMQAMDEVKHLLPPWSEIHPSDAIDLVQMFAGTWFSLDAYDKSELPHIWLSKTQVEFTADELTEALARLKIDLIQKWEATELFGQEKQSGNLSGIVGNIMQSVFGEDAYPTIESKAAHLLYFIIKNHPFNDGNKRSGAFAFVWLLQRASILDTSELSPAALTTLALLIAESNPKDKDRMVGLVK